MIAIKFILKPCFRNKLKTRLFPIESSPIYLDEKKRPKSRPANVAPKVRIEIER